MREEQDAKRNKKPWEIATHSWVVNEHWKGPRNGKPGCCNVTDINRRQYSKKVEGSIENILSPRSYSHSLGGHWCCSWEHFTWFQMTNLLIFKCVRGDQDGRKDGCGAHLFQQIDQNYIYKQNNSHRITTQLWQKISYNQNKRKTMM